MTLFAKDRAAMHQNVRSDNVFNRIEDLRMSGQVVGPAKMQVRLAQPAVYVFPSKESFQFIERSAQGSQFALGQSGDREYHTVSAISRHLVCRQRSSRFLTLSSRHFCF